MRTDTEVLVDTNVVIDRVQIARPRHQLVRHARELFPLLDDPTGLYEEWERLVTDYAVPGKQAHDARIAAAMRLLGVRRILTFNTADFARYDFIEAISPVDI